MSKAIGFIILAAAVLVGGKIAYTKLSQPKGQGAPGAPAAAKGPGTASTSPSMPVTGLVLRSERLENAITSSGTVIANEDVEIRSEVQGKVVRIAFKEGARVKKGDLLVKIDDSELQARLLQAKSAVKLATDNEFRARRQLELEAVSQKEYDQALNELNRAKAEAQLLQAQLAKTELSAPFGGVVGLKLVSEGAYVSPSTLITTLQEIDPVKLDFSVPGKYAGWVKTGQEVAFTVQGSEARHRAKVYAVDPRIDPATRTLRMRASCPNPDGAILPGAFATLHIPLEAVDAALMVPAQAVSVDARGAKVFVYKAGKAETRPVQAGLRTDSSVQITGGLAPGDTVIVGGAVAIRPGAPVTLTRVE